LSLADFESERELHIKDGFGLRQHHPDFLFRRDDKIFAVEVELTPKSKLRVEKNIRDNYIKYDAQIWLTSSNKTFALISQIADAYTNIKVMRLEEALSYGRD